MTDFLSRLVDRALGHAPVLRRRRPSWFEPTSSAVRVGATVPEFSRQAQHQELVSDQYAPGLQMAPVAHSIPPTPDHPAGDESQTGPRDRGDLGARGSLEAIPATALLAADRVESVRRMETALPLKQAMPTPIGAASAPPVLSEVVTVPHAARARSRRVERHDAPTPEPAPVRLMDRPLVAASVPRAPGETQVRTPALSPVSLPLLRAAPPAQRPLAPMARGASVSAPTIRVTIGRIEVRAVSPQPGIAAHHSRAAGPRLTLAEYLKSRAGVSR